MRLLVVTAVAAERDAISAALPEDSGTVVFAGGVGPASAAASASAALAADPSFDAVLSAGIAGGFDVPIGAVVVASAVAFADLGAETEDGFAAVSSLGFGFDRLDVPPALTAALARRTGATVGTVLTVATATGTEATLAARRDRHPDAVAEAMEGFGVATAAVVHGVPFAEVRTISNPVGPRDRASWRIPDALVALGQAFAAITKEPLP